MYKAGEKSPKTMSCPKTCLGGYSKAFCRKAFPCHKCREAKGGDHLGYAGVDPTLLPLGDSALMERRRLGDPEWLKKRRRLSNRRDSPVLLRLLEEIRQAQD